MRAVFVLAASQPAAVKVLFLSIFPLCRYKVSITSLNLRNTDFDQLALLYFQISSSGCTHLIGAFPQQPNAQFGVMGTQTINKRLKKKQNTRI